MQTTNRPFNTFELVYLHFMKVPFVNPLTAILLFVQSLLFFLRYNGDSNLKEAHWGIMLIPTFIAEIFLVIMLVSEALFESADRRRRETIHGKSNQMIVSYIL